MEPRQHEAALSIEQAPTNVGQGEHVLAPSPESSTEHRGERAPEVGQVQAEISQIAMPSLPAPLTQDSSVAGQSSSDDSSPILASDDDLIEKEWVDKAKQIIAATKDDPYKREREISKLQIDYIRKRYGRVIGDSGD